MLFPFRIPILVLDRGYGSFVGTRGTCNMYMYMLYMYMCM